MDFTNKVVIITGASSGIGRGAAEYLSSLGALCVLTARNIENLKETASKCSSETLIIQADVTKENDREKIVNETLKKFGKIDVLVNNAGFGIFKPITETSMDEFDKMIDLNVKSVVRLTQLAIPYLIKTQGNIVNVSSVGSIKATKTIGIYCMTKAAIDHFTRCLALELASQKVRVNSINPAAIVTNFAVAAGKNQEESDKMFEAVGPLHPLGRCGTVLETAHAIAYLASDMATFVTGTSLAVDGGRGINS